MRAALDEWIAEVGDLGQLDESQMVRRGYPDGRQPITDAPIAILHVEHDDGLEPVAGEVESHLPASVQLHCATQGASIGYALGDDASARWMLYSGPIRLAPGETVLRAKAIRIGYRESAEIRLVLRAR